jgi:hypothetical protein
MKPPPEMATSTVKSEVLKGALSMTGVIGQVP